VNTSFENNDKEPLAICRNRRDLRTASNATDELDLQRELGGLDERAISRNKLEALKPAFIDDRPRIDPIKDVPHQPLPGAVRWHKPIIGRMLLVVLILLAVGAVAPFGWSYLQSYESTDDAQIDGHIDPLSSRIDGTVVGVHAEDDDRVTKGELLVEIDPLDYEVAVEQAKARFALALAHIASAKQDYAAALANIREDEAANFRAQRDARRYAALLDQRVVPQEQYDQYTAIAQVDAAKVDSAQEAAASTFKAIAAHAAEADAAKAALDQALLNLSYTKIYAPANGIVGKRSVQLGSRIQPG
jgi:membrane fusion protein, multidrug efflux system